MRCSAACSSIHRPRRSPPSTCTWSSQQPTRPRPIAAPTQTGNHAVAVSWGAPLSYTGAGHPPPDFIGYRISRKDGPTGSFAVIGNTAPTTLSFVDSSIPASGGSFVYEVESVRKFASSPPMATNGALTIGGPNGAGSGGGRKSGGAGPTTSDPGAGGTGTAFYDTLPDESEPGDDALSGVPGVGAIQRFAGHDGAGLVKPFAAALALAAWAALVLFLTRR